MEWWESLGIQMSPITRSWLSFIAHHYNISIIWRGALSQIGTPFKQEKKKLLDQNTNKPISLWLKYHDKITLLISIFATICKLNPTNQKELDAARQSLCPALNISRLLQIKFINMIFKVSKITIKPNFFQNE